MPSSLSDSGYPWQSRCWYCGRFARLNRRSGARSCASGHEQVTWVEGYRPPNAHEVLLARMTGQASIRDQYHVRPVLTAWRMSDFFSDFIDHTMVQVPSPA